ncbi:MAG: hypothetical protein SOY47_16005 [Lachnospiraceae bacterium]|nr:hypothetical protein [Lachnospiraceae bacterium]
MSRVLPILFNGDMVRAILDGRKTVTRRVVKVPPYYPHFYKLHDNADGALSGTKNRLYAGFYNNERIFYIDGEKHVDALYYQAPYQPGDILYVRETWYRGLNRILYKANYSENEKFYTNGKEIQIKWHPSIHMPKEAARIWLKVKDVRVERIKDMTDKDALNEGAQGVKCDHAGLGAYGCTDCMNTGWLEPPILEFMGIWDSTIKKSDIDCYGWDANPWVWVIEFERCEKPED